PPHLHSFPTRRSSDLTGSADERVIRPGQRYAPPEMDKGGTPAPAAPSPAPLPAQPSKEPAPGVQTPPPPPGPEEKPAPDRRRRRSEEHTSELQSLRHL